MVKETGLTLSVTIKMDILYKRKTVTVLVTSDKYSTSYNLKIHCCLTKIFDKKILTLKGKSPEQFSRFSR